MPRAPLAFAMLLAALAVTCGPRPEPDSSATASQRTAMATDATIGKPAPAFTRRSLGGATITVPAKGTASVVFFFATWSHPDLMLVARMQEISLTYPCLAVVAVSINDEERDVADVTSSRGARYPIVWDAGHALATAYHVEMDPQTFVLDKNGVIRFIHRGYHDGEDSDIGAEVATLLDADVCRLPLVTNDGPACFRQCARVATAEAACVTPECRAHCSSRACRETCARDNKPRNAALAICRQKRPKARDACEAACHAEEMNNAITTCDYESAEQPALRDECAATCGVGACRASCRR